MSRVCLLTGAGGLFGNAWCGALASDYSIVAAYREVPPVIPTQEATLFDPVLPDSTVTESRDPVFAVQADLSSADEIDRLVELAMARFGRIDLVLNAAADVTTTSDTTDPRQIERWTEQLVMNALVPMQVAATVVQACWHGDEQGNRAHGRNVINMSSTAGLRGNPPTRGRAIYAASKLALNSITRRMALDYARFGVRVNAVAPTNFPQSVPTERVVEVVRDIDGGTMTGKLRVLDGAREYWL